jgi:glycosyltransferase involved in cell wall biosynthesis
MEMMLNTANADQMDVTIIVSPRERFEQAIMSLSAFFRTADMPFRLIYVDGGSPAEIARTLKTEVESRGHTYIRRPGYVTPNDARNTALPFVDTKYVVFIDNDVVFAEGWLSAMVKCAEETGAGLVTPTILVGPESRMPDLRIHHAGGILKLTDVGSSREMYRRHGHEHELYLEKKDELVRTKTESTEFHVVLARRDMLEDIGPLDPKLAGFTDEIDMAFKAKEKGWEIWYEPSSVVAYAVGKKMTWREIPYFCLRWKTSGAMNAERYFYKKWNLVPEFSRQRGFLRDHRRHAFPFKGMQKIVGWRITVTFTTLLCETIALIASARFLKPDMSPPPVSSAVRGSESPVLAES